MKQEIIRLLQNLVDSKNPLNDDVKILRKLIANLNLSQSGTLTKGHLADQYGLSVQTFVKRMNQCPALIRELSEMNVDKWQKLFFPKEIECIYRHLGKPTNAL